MMFGFWRFCRCMAPPQRVFQKAGGTALISRNVADLYTFMYNSSAGEWLMRYDYSRDPWRPIFNAGKKKLQSQQGQRDCTVYVNKEATIWLYGRQWWSDLGKEVKSCLQCLPRMANSSTKPGQWVQGAVKPGVVRWNIFSNGETLLSKMQAQRFGDERAKLVWVLHDCNMQTEVKLTLRSCTANLHVQSEEQVRWFGPLLTSKRGPGSKNLCVYWTR